MAESKIYKYNYWVTYPEVEAHAHAEIKIKKAKDFLGLRSLGKTIFYCLIPLTLIALQDRLNFPPIYLYLFLGIGFGLLLMFVLPYLFLRMTKGRSLFKKAEKTSKSDNEQGDFTATISIKGVSGGLSDHLPSQTHLMSWHEISSVKIDEKRINLLFIDQKGDLAISLPIRIFTSHEELEELISFIQKQIALSKRNNEIL